MYAFPLNGCWLNAKELKTNRPFTEESKQSLSFARLAMFKEPSSPKPLKMALFNSLSAVPIPMK